MRAFFTLCCILLMGLSACKKDKVQTDFDKSYDAWQLFKKSSGNSYKYIVTSGSWVGTVDSTTITVSGGEVVARSYKYYVPVQNGNNELVVREEWQENHAQLNTHDTGAAALTLDQIYTKAKNEWLKVDKKENEIYFEASNSGMISSCGYVPNGCMDDCFNGITIASITKSGVNP